jgi:hypothetical protein
MLELLLILALYHVVYSCFEHWTNTDFKDNHRKGRHA